MNEEKQKKNDIANYYEKIPKKYINKNIANPNVDKHHINKLPFRMVVNGPSGSFKTNFLFHLISLFCEGAGTFADITIICGIGNADQPLYKYLADKDVTILEGLSNIPKLESFDKDVSHLLCFDDLVLNKNQEMIENYYVRCRHRNVSVVYLSQGWYLMPKVIRQNANIAVIMRVDGSRDLQMILKEFGNGMTSNQLMKMYKYATQTSGTPFIIDNEASPDKKFRRGLSEFLDPSKFE
jgi:hypothetical protein